MRRSDSFVEVLQWFGLLAAGLAWTAQLVLGFGVSIAACSAGSAGWGLDVRTWAIVLTAAGATIALLAEAAAVTVFLDARDADEYGSPPWGRRHFLAVAAIVGNLLFFVAILLNGLAVFSHSTCVQS
ncbi:MAG: hypothetical protein ACXVFC_07445 [Gaiellaceae bacterium]